MVSTRHHPKEFPEPASPTSSPSSPSKALVKTPSKKSASNGPFAHTPSQIITIWLLASLPLIFWDTGYVLLRPHSMTGGALHSPIWTPYALYGTVDYMYGWPAWNAHNGFTAAQGMLNIAESVIYIFYLWVVYAYGKGTGRKQAKTVQWYVLDDKTVPGAMGSLALLVAFSGAVMTVSKTFLYWLNEAFSGFENIGHNSFMTLFPLWIIPNGAWIIFPSYMIYVFGTEILEGLAIASGDKSKSK